MVVQGLKAAALVAFLAVNALVMATDDADARKRRPGVRGTPGPIAGAGLPFLLAAGGYIYLRRRKSRAADLPSDQDK